MKIKGKQLTDDLELDTITLSGNLNFGANITIDGSTFSNTNTEGSFQFNPDEIGAFIITHGGSIGSGATYNIGRDTLILDSTGQTMINLLSANTTRGGLIFGDADDNEVAVFQYAHNTNIMALTVNNAILPSQEWLPNGEIVSQLQPFFYAYKSAQTPGAVTGDGTIYTVICNIEVDDIGSNYDNTTGIFTAPVDGRYVFTGCVRFSSITSAHTFGLTFLTTSNVTLYGDYVNPYASGTIVFQNTWYINMDQGDTAKLDILISNGAKVVHVDGSAAFIYTYFTGGLIC